MFYSVLQLDSRIAHPDQALTETIDRWSTSCSQLYSDITKPLLDIVLFAWKISDVIGPLGPISVVAYYIFCGVIIQTISPRFGRMTAQTQRLEGSFRNAHHRLITSSEEISLSAQPRRMPHTLSSPAGLRLTSACNDVVVRSYGGQDREKQLINAQFSEVVVNQSEFFRKQLGQSMSISLRCASRAHQTVRSHVSAGAAGVAVCRHGGVGWVPDQVRSRVAGVQCAGPPRVRPWQRRLQRGRRQRPRTDHAGLCPQQRPTHVSTPFSLAPAQPLPPSRMLTPFSQPPCPRAATSRRPLVAS